MGSSAVFIVVPFEFVADMSKPAQRGARMPVTKKKQDWDTSTGDFSQHRLSDDEVNRRKQAFQPRNFALQKEEKQRQILAKAVQEARQKNKKQLGILREILFSERDIDELMQKSNGVSQLGRSDKFVPKSSLLRSGKNHFTSLANNRNKRQRPTSAKTLNSSRNWDQSEEDALSVSSSDHEDNEVENEPVRLKHSNASKTKNYQRPSSAYHYSLSENKSITDGEHTSKRLQQPNVPTRSTNVSCMSDISKTGKTTSQSTSGNPLTPLLNQLSSNMSELESVTGFKPLRDDGTISQPNMCSTALITALISLTGHVKQCVIISKNKSGSDSYASSTSSFRQEMTSFKEQLAVVAKAQLDFQKKIENQITMLQTMMQSVCQLVNNEIATKSRSYDGHQQYSNTSNISTMHHMNSSRQQQTLGFDASESHDTTQNWMSTKMKLNNNNRQTTIVPKRDIDKRLTPASSDELLSYGNTIMQRRDNITNDSAHRNTSAMLSNRSTYTEVLDASKKFTRPTSASSSDQIIKQTYTVTTNNNGRKNDEQELNSHIRTAMISPDMPSYDIFESGLPNQQQTIRYPQSSNNETILEKILQERLLLVQQIAELNKQHESTQEELANLEANASNNDNNH